MILALAAVLLTWVGLGMLYNIVAKGNFKASRGNILNVFFTTFAVAVAVNVDEGWFGNTLFGCSKVLLKVCVHAL